MLRLPPFAYLGARTVGDALQFMRDHGGDAMLVAGGTDLYPNMKRRQFEPSVLVGLRGIRELGGISGSAESGFAIGSQTTLTRVATGSDEVEPTELWQVRLGWKTGMLLQNSDPVVRGQPIWSPLKQMTRGVPS